MDKKVIINNVTRLMDNRVYALAPFPLDINEVFWSTWDPDLAKAAKMLRDSPEGRYHDAVDTRHFFNMHGIPTATGSEARVHFTIPENQKTVVDMSYGFPRFSDLPKDFQNTIAEWYPRHQTLRVQQSKTSSYVERVLESWLKTPGQIARVWPSLVGCLDSEDRERLSKTRIQSRLHENCYETEKVETGEFYTVQYTGERKPVLEYKRTGKLIFELRRETLDEYDHWLCEALMLPIIQLHQRVQIQ